MKSYLVVLVASVALSLVAADTNLTCTLSESRVPTTWIDNKDLCRDTLGLHIQKEFQASFDYLLKGAYFSRDTVNRPGFADFFFKAAKEEREHGRVLIDYLSMRGALPESVVNLKIPHLEVPTWSSGAEALEDALNLETKVTKSIRNVIDVCEKTKGYNDYHLVDYLTGVYLEEQYKATRELAGKLSTLQKMEKKHGALAEFLFDKKNM